MPGEKQIKDRRQDAEGDEHPRHRLEHRQSPRIQHRQQLQLPQKHSRPGQEKGVLDIDENNSVRSFREKSAKDASPINAGFMVLEPRIFDYLEGDSTIFERTPLERLSAEGELKSYIFDGFWQCMDSKREHDILEKLYAEGKAPWKVW